jgi:hypothetical protein
MRLERIPIEIIELFLELWADEGFEFYWKLSPGWGRHSRGFGG